MGIYEVFLSALIAGLLLLMAAYVLAKRYVETLKNTLIQQVVDEGINGLTDWINTEEGQKTFYTIGGLIGNGARQGMGIAKGGGKTGLLDVVLQLGSQFLMPKNTGSQGLNNLADNSRLGKSE